ncbi:hypothetical protein [Actinoplanes sp. HUAS TT8]
MLRGIEAVGKAGVDAETIDGVADTVLSLLPRVSANATAPAR